MWSDSIVKNLSEVKARIGEAAAASGRDESLITVVAASKTRSQQTLREFEKLCPGSIFGENRVQEFNLKYTPDLQWHFIGRLQTNKVKYLIGKVGLIHSVDNVRLLEEIDRLSLKRKLLTDVLVEVNTGGELSKGGLAPSEVEKFILDAQRYKGVAIKGIMSVMPHVTGQALCDCYARLKELYDSLFAVKSDNYRNLILSAGMSEDYEVAVRYGSNMLRLGRALFGERL
ncbi:MAG TPA: YggS family pyridoxal phosphate-dependent enzyme [Candidatus Faecicola pullistercoris]|nr:YggS family pyridoxal phosphate-dependent enzyme [Candidatus Faecicola pullistercoris]